MSLATAKLPTDPAALRAFALACQGELKAAQTAVQLNAVEIEKLRFQIAKLRRMQFGRSSERITRQIEQLELQLEELETGEAEDVARAEASEPAAPIPVRAKPKRKPLPEHLPRQEVMHQPEGDGACICPACGGGMGKLGEDVTEVLDYVPGHFQVIRHVRPKYACRACDAITQAPAPAMPTPRGRATPAMLAHLLVSKYCDHLPLYRQCEIYAREGLELDRSTLCDWVGQAAWLLDPIVDAIRTHVFAAEKIHGDDTTVPVLAPGLGRTKTGRLWVYVRDDRPFCGEAPPAAAYFYSPDRAGAHPAAHMATFTGLLQADGYTGFEKLYDPTRGKPGPITEVACWAHARRGFFDEWEHHKSATAKQAIDRIAAIYAIEARAAFAPVSERVQLRRETVPLLDAFFDWAEAAAAKVSAKSALADAFRYAINRREALSRFVTDGRLEVDNNIAENAMRCIALGRKNYLFAGSDIGGERAASIYTIVQTAKLNGVNPEGYLRDIFLTKIADGHPINRVGDLMPWN
jgi:transposase